MLFTLPNLSALLCFLRMHAQQTCPTMSLDYNSIVLANPTAGYTIRIKSAKQFYYNASSIFNVICSSEGKVIGIILPDIIPVSTTNDHAVALITTTNPISTMHNTAETSVLKTNRVSTFNSHAVTELMQTNKISTLNDITHTMTVLTTENDLPASNDGAMAISTNTNELTISTDQATSVLTTKHTLTKSNDQEKTASTTINELATSHDHATNALTGTNELPTSYDIEAAVWLTKNELPSLNDHETTTIATLYIINHTSAPAKLTTQLINSEQRKREKALLFGGYGEKHSQVVQFDPDEFDNPFSYTEHYSKYYHWSTVGGTFNGVFYFAGVGSDTIELFNISIMSFVENTTIQMPTKRSLFCGGIVSDNLIFCGGNSKGVFLRSYDVLNLTALDWSNQIFMIEARSAACSLVSKYGVFFLFGPGKTAEKYDSTIKKFYRIADMPNKHRGCAAAEFDERIFVCGDGVTNTGVADDKCDVYDFTLDSWGTTLFMKEARRALNLVVLNNNLYVLFGTNTDGGGQTVERMINGSFETMYSYPGFRRTNFMSIVV